MDEHINMDDEQKLADVWAHGQKLSKIGTVKNLEIKEQEHTLHTATSQTDKQTTMDKDRQRETYKRRTETDMQQDNKTDDKRCEMQLCFVTRLAPT